MYGSGRIYYHNAEAQLSRNCYTCRKTFFASDMTRIDKNAEEDMKHYPKRLKRNKNFTPCPAANGDELYPNGIFVFNITKLVEYIKDNPEKISLEKILVNQFYTSHSTINEDHMDTVDISRPVLIAEITPGRYNLIDGHHRMEKARRMDISTMPAYKLNVDQHIAFLTNDKAYATYIEYWNEKRSRIVRLDPKKYGLHPRTVLEQVDINTVAIVIDRKSRIIMSDGRKIVKKAMKIQEIQPEVIVVLQNSAPVCSKMVKLLEEEGIRTIKFSFS